MRTALTIGTRHGGKSQAVIAGEAVPLPKQLADFKAMSLEAVHPDFERVDYWEKDGGKVKTKCFAKPEKSKKE